MASAATTRRFAASRGRWPWLAATARRFLLSAAAENTAQCRKHPAVQKTPRRANTAQCRKHPAVQKTP
ncbi:hypothetical protein OH146_04345, partial [Salinibacterium sp. SYSU T00001]|uniref:hypothetical protein n=1 Tax=Homoserinimonas sedimenticola TaxID=2986805 RepID=UPI002236083A